VRPAAKSGFAERVEVLTKLAKIDGAREATVSAGAESAGGVRGRIIVGDEDCIENEAGLSKCLDNSHSVAAGTIGNEGNTCTIALRERGGVLRGKSDQRLEVPGLEKTGKRLLLEVIRT
jgi:hypothetical protein